MGRDSAILFHLSVIGPPSDVGLYMDRIGLDFRSFQMHGRFRLQEGFALLIALEEPHWNKPLGFDCL